MSEELGPDWWSWQDIVGRADQLGIPNFQRGAVWGSAAAGCGKALRTAHAGRPRAHQRPATP